MKFYNPLRPPPAPPGFAKGQILPERNSGPLSRLLFFWVSPFLDVGFSRPLEKDDLWLLPDGFLTENITASVEANFYARCPPESCPKHLRDTPSSQTDSEEDGQPSRKTPLYWFSRKSKPKQDASLLKALNQTFFYRIWLDGLFKLLSDTLYTTVPLVNKLLLTWLVESYTYYRLPDEAKAAGVIPKPRGIGYGIGLAFAILVMQETASLFNNHHFQLGQTNGLLIRSALIGNIFRKALRLSGRARLEHTSGKITTMISNDASRFDRFSGFGHQLWTAPIQLAIGIGLLIGNLGYSALVGLGVLLLSFPIQLLVVKQMFKHGKKAIAMTDQRVRSITEILQGIRLVKFYAWEDFFLESIGQVRKKEMWELRMLSTWRSVIMMLVVCMPVFAAVLSFITYALTGHDLDIAIIFSSLQLFNIIRMPLVFLPFVLSLFSDLLVSLGRIGKYLIAEELPDAYVIDPDCKYAVTVDGCFTWEKPKAEAKVAGRGKPKPAEKKKQRGGKKDQQPILPTTAPADEKYDSDEKEKKTDSDQEEETPFALKDLQLRVERGLFVGIVGKVGSGKSSILQAMIGEMRKTKGDVLLGGTIAYVPQTAWIRNATLRDNIIFGKEVDEARLRAVVRACSLEHDIEILPQGEVTEIGERGINLSGGQKTRVSLARAAYSSADIVLLDDPLSAVDAYVGNAILTNCILSGPLANKTRIMTTHALHVLDKTDYIYVIDNGTIVEQGKFKDLMGGNAMFARIMDEYGHSEREKKDDDEKKEAKNPEDEKEAQEKKELMQEEERYVGSVAWKTYAGFLRLSGGIMLGPFILFLLTLMQGAQVANTLFLSFWTSQSINGFTQAHYMGLYAGLGVAQAVFSFILSFTLAMTILTASYHLFRIGMRSVMRSPVSFFDTTPLGRILSRLAKDQDTLDKELVMSLTSLALNASQVVGTIGLVFYVFPYLGILFAPLSVVYYLSALYYRRSSVETKRLDSLLRSVLYASFSESLSGLSTIRAYRDASSSIHNAEHGLDLENRAYYLSITIQRWLSVRLDFFSNILLFGVAMFAAGFRNTVDPSKIGVVLTYAVSVTQIFSDMVSQFALNEQNMNAAERMLVYANLPPEGETVTDHDPPSSWPDKGVIKFSDVDLKYRPELPLVLNKISFELNAGEKIGIVGRTGAGKSSLLQALFRIVNLTDGAIEIDGTNIKDIGLTTLRSRLALVPQDSVLFKGTLRNNLDPLSSRTDAELISALQRAWLLPREGKDPMAEAKFSLDSVVSDEGGNFSQGEKQLLSLCRALVKNSRIIVLDEATSSVDVETDSKLQRTIQTEFSTSTVLCIAHRLNTIAYYDRIVVMDSGRIAEMDTVLNLYDNEGSIFRSLCNEANLTRADIIRIRESHKKLVIEES